MADAEKFVGRGTETRTFVYFKVSARALQAFVPDEWEISPASSGRSCDANLLVAFVDQATALDAAGKPLRPLRNVLFEIPVRKRGGEARAMMLFTGLSSGGPGPYSTNLLAAAHVERKVRHEPSGSFVEESWALNAPDAARVSLELQFVRGPTTIEEVESRVYSQVQPQFSRIYRVEQAADLVWSTTETLRLRKFTFEAMSDKLTPLFDGSEQLISIVSVPVYARRIYLPGP